MSTISTLNNIIKILKDGQEGFRDASTDVENHDLKEVFSRYSLQRSQLAGELQALVQSLGESDPADRGSVIGAMHRGWINLKAALISKDEHAVLAECESGEDAAVAAYRDALKKEDLPANVRATLTQQAVIVKAAHDDIRNRRDAAALVNA
jgi:uncharacterized protein (TIGR02284 family)